MFVTPHNLGVGASAFNFNDGKGGTHTLTIISTNTSWEITGIPDWLSVDKTAGSGKETVTLTCEENLSPKNGRASIFYVRSTEEDWEYSIPISVSQVCAVEDIEFIGTSPIYFDGGSDNQTYYVLSNVEDWTVEVYSEDNASWLTVTKADGKSFTVAVQPNPNKADRKAYVTLHTRDRQKQLTVVQRPGKIVLTKESLSYTYEGGEQRASVTSDAPWTVETSESWLEVLPAKGSSGTTDVTVRTTANYSFSPRSGSVYFVMADDNKIALPVNQGNITFSLSRDALPFSYSAESKSLSITSNAEWLLSSDTPEWLTLSTTEGNGNAEVSVSAQTNASVYPRTALLSFRPTLIDTNFDVSVSQAPQEMTPDTTAMLFSSMGGSQQFSFEATGEWAVVADKEWISVVDVTTGKTTGTGNATCRVTVDENKAGSVRNGEVRIIFYENEYVIPVSQQEMALSLSLELIECKSTGGSYDIDLYSKVHWNAAIEDNAAWLTANPTEGEDSCRFTITVADNPSLASRTGKVLVTAEDQPSLAVTVNQSPRYLNVNTGSVEFFAKGGASELITVETDGEYDVKTASDWLTIEKIGGNGFVLKATDNLTADQRTGTVEVSLTNLAEGELSRIITVSQDVHYLRVGTNSLTFHAAGGISDEISIETDGDFMVVPLEDWLSVTVNENKIVITAEENDSQTPRTSDIRITLTGIVSGSIEEVISVEQGCRGIAVDLGLPSGLLWATFNIGALSENGAGDYFAWGETEPKELYKWSTYKYCEEGDKSRIWKYNTVSELDPSDDAATVHWGKNWRIPTSSEWNELQEECTWLWYEGSNRAGYRIKGPNGKEIFLPAAGSCDGKTLTGVLSEGRYWSSTSCDNQESYRAWRMAFNTSDKTANSYYDKFIGYSVRPVFSSKLSVSKSLIEITAKGGTSELITVDAEEGFDVSPSSSSDAEWLTVNMVDDNSFTIIATENQTSSVRTGSIIVTSRSSNSIKRTITVSQTSYSLKVSKDKTDFPHEGGTSDAITVTTDGIFTVTIPDNCKTWLSYAVSGQSFTLTATANTTTSTRSGTVTVSLSGLTEGKKEHTISVTQAPPPTFSLSAEELSFTSAGGTKYLSVTSNQSWTVSTDVSWLTLSKTSGTGYASLSVTASSNDSFNRSGSVTFTAGGKTYTVNITQEGIDNSNHEPGDYSSDYTGNIVLSADGGTNTSTCIVRIGDTDYNGIKAGTTSKAGAMIITVPAGTKYLHLHAAAWKGSTVTLGVTPEGISDDITLTADEGIASNSPFTFSGDPSTSDYYKVITFADALTTDTDLTFSAKEGYRFVVWGVTAQEDGSVASVKKPTFNPAGGIYSEAQLVSISCATEGATIYYTTDGTTPTYYNTKYTGPLTIANTTTLQAIAYKDGNASSVAMATYTFTTYKTIANVRAQETGVVYTRGVVTSVKGKTAYIQDNTGAIAVFGTNTLPYAIGDEISVKGTLSTYMGLLEIINPTIDVLSQGNAVNPAVKTIAEISADYYGSNAWQGMLVKIVDATVMELNGNYTTIAQDENTITIYGNLDVEVAVNDVISLVGNIGCFNSLQIVNARDVTVKQGSSISSNVLPDNEKDAGESLATPFNPFRNRNRVSR